MATIPEAHPVGAGELYTPIASWQTRVLRLHSSSGGKNDVLRADLLVAGLLHDEGVVFGMDNGEPTKYEAISYSWGLDNATERIIVNGLRRHINPSLAGALRRFRLPEESRYLWADAICINQADNAEKSAQVRSMFTIFRKAARVLAWLGDEGAGSSQALASYIAHYSGLLDTASQSKERDIVLDVGGTYDELAAVALAPWPRRAWVQQEVFASRELTLYYGRCEMSLDHYFGLLEQLCKLPVNGRLEELERQRKVLASLCGLRRSDERLNELELARLMSAKSEQSASFLENIDSRLKNAEPAVLAYSATLLEGGLSRSRYLDATDPRDFVYALLSLTHQIMARSQSEEARSVRGTAMYIDYSKSVTRVFQDATRPIINAKEKETAHYRQWWPTRFTPTIQARRTSLVSHPKYTGSIRTLILHSHITLKPNKALSWDWTWSTETHPTPRFEIPSTDATRLKPDDLFVQVEGWDFPVILREEEVVGPAKRFRLVDVVSDQDFVLSILGTEQYQLVELRPTHDGSMANLVGLIRKLVACVSLGNKQDFVVC
ncbi:hypothetical protein LTR74_007651 [Friedmanniomyces endolithicus]|nr:hypothetical protein LTR74_007651 [Friedmanniomyces endolithicus]